MSDITLKRDRRFFFNILLCIVMALIVYGLTSYDGDGLSFIIPMDNFLGQ